MSEIYQKIFTSLTNEADIFINENINVVQKFTALMYGIRNCTSVNDERYLISKKSYATKKDNERLIEKIEKL